MPDTAPGCVPSTFYIRMTRWARASKQRLSKEASTAKSKAKRCVAATRAAWRSTAERLRWRQRPSTKSAGVGTELPLCHDAEVMTCTGPVSDGSPLSSNSVASMRQRFVRRDGTPASFGRRKTAYQRRQAVDKELDKERLEQQSRVRLDRACQTEDDEQPSYEALVDAYCDYKAKVTVKILNLGEKYTNKCDKMLVGRVWSWWRQYCMAAKAEGIKESLAWHRLEEDRLREAIKALEGRIQGISYTDLSGTEKRPMLTGLARERPLPESPPSVSSLAATIPKKGLLSTRAPDCGGVELYDGPVFEPALPKVDVEPLPSPVMVDATRVPWAHRLDNTVSGQTTVRKKIEEHAIELPPKTALFKTSESPERFIVASKPNVELLGNDLWKGSSLSGPEGTSNVIDTPVAHYNEVLVRKILEKGSQGGAKGGQSSQMTVDNFRQKMEALKLLEEAVFNKPKFTNIHLAAGV